MEDFSRSQIAESFPRSIVDSRDVEGKDGGAHVEQVLILWKKLTQQTVGVLVGAALP